MNTPSTTLHNDMNDLFGRSSHGFWVLQYISHRDVRILRLACDPGDPGFNASMRRVSAKNIDFSCFIHCVSWFVFLCGFPRRVIIINEEGGRQELWHYTALWSRDQNMWCFTSLDSVPACLVWTGGVHTRNHEWMSVFFELFPLTRSRRSMIFCMRLMLTAVFERRKNHLENDRNESSLTWGGAAMCKNVGVDCCRLGWHPCLSSGGPVSNWWLHVAVSSVRSHFVEPWILRYLIKA